MTVGKHEVLAFPVNLPYFRYGGIGRPAHAILRVIILVRVQGIEMQCAAADPRRITTQDKG